MLFATFISSFVQLGIALLIPAIWWAVTTKRCLEFATWIGLYVPTWKLGPVQRVSQKQLGIALVCWVAVSLSRWRHFGLQARYGVLWRPRDLWVLDFLQSSRSFSTLLFRPAWLRNFSSVAS